MGKEITEKSEIERLSSLYEDIPENKRAIAEGLIVQAARIRVQLDILWKDLQENGSTELFSQSEKTEPYQRERPSARLFVSLDKNYLAIIKQLNDLLPVGETDIFAELAEFRSE